MKRKYKVKLILFLLMILHFLYGISQDTIVKFDKLIAKGKFFKVDASDGFKPNSIITTKGTDGQVYFADGKPYKEISRKWVQYQKMKFYTRDEISQSGHKVWHLNFVNKNKEVESFDDIVESKINPSREKLNSDEVILYSPSKKTWMKLTNIGCYRGRNIIVKPVQKIHNLPMTQKKADYNTKENKKLFCTYCNKQIKNNDFAFYLRVSEMFEWFEVNKFQVEANDNDVWNNSELFCNRQHAIEFQKAKTPHKHLRY
jgi:hypothetical protein